MIKTNDMNKPILVTGGTGYIASWVVKYLLEDGYTVHATVRDKEKAERNKHLVDLAKNAKGELKLFEADLQKEGSFTDPMKGCETVIHMASPFFISGFKDAQKELIDPALNGTRNVLESANKVETVKRVVQTSSVVAIYGDNEEIKNTKNGIFTEEYWNHTSSVAHQPYAYSKTLAEKEGWKIAENQDRWDLVVINPGFVLGPSLSQRTDSTSISFMRSLLNGEFRQGIPDLHFGVVDVRDVAKAHIEAALNGKASGRHILVSESKTALEMAKILKNEWGDQYPVPGKKLPNFLLYIFGPFQGFSWKYIRKNIGVPLKFDNSYSKTDLGIQYRPVEETLIDHARQLIHDNLIKRK
jgi:nucleoside-diphosphate-sugar epimerase